MYVSVMFSDRRMSWCMPNRKASVTGQPRWLR